MIILFGATIILIILASLFFLLSRHFSQSVGLPEGRLVYADTGDWRRAEENLFSAHYGLVGRPDYLVRKNGVIIPIELKPLRVATKPYESDIIQLAAYCLLVTEHYGQRPPYGLLKYRDTTFTVDFTSQLESLLLDTLHLMRLDLQEEDDSLIEPNHNQPSRCRACDLNDICEMALDRN